MVYCSMVYSFCSFTLLIKLVFFMIYVLLTYIVTLHMNTIQSLYDLLWFAAFSYLHSGYVITEILIVEL
jgi:hypothetical protein